MEFVQIEDLIRRRLAEGNEGSEDREHIELFDSEPAAEDDNSPPASGGAAVPDLEGRAGRRRARGGRRGRGGGAEGGRGRAPRDAAGVAGKAVLEAPPAARLPPEPLAPRIRHDVAEDLEPGGMGVREPLERRRPTHVERGEGRLPAGFAALGIGEPLLRALRHAGFEAPTPIQEVAIPHALAGRDVVGQARTGTGKTAAFALPILARAREGEGPQALVLAPTRELALQVRDEFERLGRYTGLRTVAIYGGVPLEGQRRALAEGREILVATPGRLLDHERRRAIDLAKIEVVVIDECDRMFDLGFRPDIERILRSCSGKRQLLLFSATIGEDVLKLADRYMRDPVRLYTAPETLTVDRVTQSFVSVAKDRKRSALAALLRAQKPEQAIVFCRTKIGCEKVAKWLNENGCEADELHGDLRQDKRERILKRLREGKSRLLVATDVAARGLDIPAISHIYNYDIPEYPEDYVHRIGRTARMGAAGSAVTLVEPGQGAFLTEIEKLTNVEVKELTLEGFDPGLAKAAMPGKPRQTGTGTILFSTWTGGGRG